MKRQVTLRIAPYSQDRSNDSLIGGHNSHYCRVTRPQVARWAIVALFAYAAIYNTWLGLTRPEEYQGFAELVLTPWYRDFIHGPLREHGSTIIPAIAAGQALSAILVALGGRCSWVGAIGVCVFLFAIVPLGVGSAVPISFLVSLAAIAAVGAITASCTEPPPGSPGTSSSDPAGSTSYGPDSPGARRGRGRSPRSGEP